MPQEVGYLWRAKHHKLSIIVYQPTPGQIAVFARVGDSVSVKIRGTATILVKDVNFNIEKGKFNFRQEISFLTEITTVVLY